jgi:hypothetical protein
MPSERNVGPTASSDEGAVARMRAAAGQAREIAGQAREVAARGIEKALDRVFAAPLDVRSAVEAMAMVETQPTSGALRRGAQWAAARTATRVGTRLGPKAAGRVALPLGVAIELGLASKGGIKELQVLASFLLARLRDDGHPVDRELVRRATLAIYLDPDRTPDLRVAVHRRSLAVAKRWSVDAFPLNGRALASRTRARVDAIARLDTAQLVHAWRLVDAMEAKVVDRQPPTANGTAPGPPPPPPPLPPGR